MYNLDNGESTAFRIRHESEQSYKDIASTYGVCPTAVQASSNVISRSWNNIQGDFVDHLIAHKAKIIWEFDATVGTSGLESLWSYLSTAIKTYKTRFFWISGWMPGFGFKKGLFYLGTPTNFNAEGVDAGNKYKAASNKFELHWIEKGDSSTRI